MGASDRLNLCLAFGYAADTCQVEAEVSEGMNQFEASQSGLVIAAVASPGAARLWDELVSLDREPRLIRVILGGCEVVSEVRSLPLQGRRVLDSLAPGDLHSLATESAWRALLGPAYSDLLDEVANVAAPLRDVPTRY
jgi:hypothetical protein